MWLINKLGENLGFYAVLGYALIAGIYKLFTTRRLELELRRLVDEQERSQDTGQ